MTKTQTVTVELHKWAEGSWGLVIVDVLGSGGLEPHAVFEVTTTSKSKVAPLIVAHLLGADTSHAVYRVR